jgi:hypothetical protein
MSDEMGYLCNDFFTCTRKDYDEKMWYCQTFCEYQTTRVCGGIARKINLPKFALLMKEAILEGEENENKM